MNYSSTTVDWVHKAKIVLEYLPIWTPACPTWMEIHSLIFLYFFEFDKLDKNEEKEKIISFLY